MRVHLIRQSEDISFGRTSLLLKRETCIFHFCTSLSFVSVILQLKSDVSLY